MSCGSIGEVVFAATPRVKVMCRCAFWAEAAGPLNSHHRRGGRNRATMLRDAPRRSSMLFFLLQRGGAAGVVAARSGSAEAATVARCGWVRHTG